MQLERKEKSPVPEWVQEIVAAVAPKVSSSTQFVCKETDPNVGQSARDGELVIAICKSVSVQTTNFDTDGDWTDKTPLPYSDGTVKHRTVTGYKWAIVENVVKGEDGATRIVQTCYVLNKQVYLELRAAVGLHGW